MLIPAAQESGKELPSETDPARRPQPSALLSLRSAARYLDCPPETIRWWIKEGRFSKVKIGRRVLLLRAELDRYIDAHTEEPKGA